MSDQIRPLRAKAMTNLSREHTLARRVTLRKIANALTEASTSTDMAGSRELLALSTVINDVPLRSQFLKSY